MNPSETFIRRPVATTLLTLGVAMAGGLAFFLLPVSPLPQVDFPTISVRASHAGRQPRSDGDQRGDALGAPFRPDRRCHRNDLVELGRLDPHHAPIRPRPRHRRRRARRAGGDQRGARRSADQPQAEPDLPQGQPGRRADHDPGAHLRHAHPRPDVRRGHHHHRSRSCRRSTASARSMSAARRCPRSGPSSTPTRSANTASGSRTCARRSPSANAHSPKGAIEQAGKHYQIYANDNASTSAQFANLIIAYRNHAAVRLVRRGAGQRFGREHPQCRPRQRQAGGAGDRLPPARRQHHQHGGPGARAAAVPASRNPRRHRHHAGDGPIGHHPRLAQGCRAHADDLGRARDHGGVPVFEERPRHADPGGGGAGVADRHLRRDVSAGLQPRQSLAHGAHRGDRLRGRRRHRRAGEHHAPSSKPACRASRPRIAGRARGELHRPVDEPVAGGGVHAHPADGRHHRPPVPRIRDDAVDRDPGLAAGVAYRPRR